MNGAFALAAWEGDQFEQAADGQVSLCGMAQHAAQVKGVPGAPTVPLAACAGFRSDVAVLSLTASHPLRVAP
ncbi:hypothetical protein [Streptomyces drozdowiczii]|uniref:hypothetical protein n=1 Tax=Streptomyces drozdowiczii TaxID=202862 RepID=UPI00403C5FB3